MEVEATMDTTTLGLAEPTPWSEKSLQVPSPTASTASATASSDQKETPQSECSSGGFDLTAEEVRVVKPEAWEVAVREKFSDIIGLEGPENRVPRELINRMVRMLRLCNYPLESINSVLAASLALFEQVCKALPAGGKNMVPVERTAIAILSCYLEHTYILDETCPLHYWPAGKTWCRWSALPSRFSRAIWSTRTSSTRLARCITGRRGFTWTTAL